MGPRSIIIKATRAASYNPRAADAYATFGFVKEWAAANYLACHAVGQPFTPTLLAYDLDKGVPIFEDVGQSVPSLVGPLLHGTADEAEQALTAYAEALATLHRATTGCRSGHAAILRDGFPSSAIPPPAHRWIEDVARPLHDLLGPALPEDEADLVAERLRQPGGWQVLVHSDPCPDNILLDADGHAVLIDLEFARPGHALLDAAYWRMGFQPAGVPELSQLRSCTALIRTTRSHCSRRACRSRRRCVVAYPSGRAGRWFG